MIIDRRTYFTFPSAWLLAVGLPLLTALFIASCETVPEDFPSKMLERGEFYIAQIESGEIQAASGEVIVSPRIRGRLKILHLWPEGAQVEVGDLLLQFDPAEFEVGMIEREGQLEQAVADYEKAKAQREQRLADIKRRIQQQEAQFRLSELSLQRAELCSPIEKEQAKIQLEKAKRALIEARADSTAQEVINRVDLFNHQRNINRRKQRYEEARDDYERTSVYAEKPGIVVYRKIWKPGTDEDSKVAVGDEVWGGRALMDIPDLSKMQVLCLIGEMDIKRMEVGQKVFIRLEAFPGPVFHGSVFSLAPMATPQPGAPDIRVFEMVINIEEQDARLKPGMSAEVEVVVGSVADALSIPLDAIFARDGKTIVYRLDGRSFDPVEVELGKRNATAAVVLSGLEEGDSIALKDPTQK